MARTIMPIFDICQDEGKIVGRLLAGYGELEFALCGCLASAIGNTDVAGRILYRTRGEEQRILIADAVMRVKYNATGLINPYSEAIADIGWCRQLRNQYAHAHWISISSGSGLAIIDIDKAMQSKLGTIIAKTYYMDVPLLQRQEEYFVYVHECLTSLRCEYDHLAGGLPSHAFQLPKKIARPPRYNANP